MPSSAAIVATRRKYLNHRAGKVEKKQKQDGAGHGALKSWSTAIYTISAPATLSLTGPPHVRPYEARQIAMLILRATKFSRASAIKGGF